MGLLISIIFSLSVWIVNYIGYGNWFESYVIYLLLLILGAAHLVGGLRDFIQDHKYSADRVPIILCVITAVLFIVDFIYLYGILDYAGSAVEITLLIGALLVYAVKEDFDIAEDVLEIFGCLGPANYICKLLEKKKEDKKNRQRSEYEDTTEYKEKLAIFEKRKEQEKRIIAEERIRAKKRVANKKSADEQIVADWKINALKKAKDQRASYHDNHQNKFKYKTLVDSRDGKSYRTVKIGDMEWMAEPLMLKGQEQLDWATAMGLPSKYNNSALTDTTKALIDAGNYQGIAPEGWHIPSRYEWKLLLNYVEEHCEFSAFDALRSDGDIWKGLIKSVSGNKISTVEEGKDVFGLSIMPRILGGVFYGRNLWTCDTANNWSAYCLKINTNGLKIATEDKAVSVGSDNSGYEKTANVYCVKNLDSKLLSQIEFLRKAEEERQRQEEERRHREYLEEQARRAADAAEQQQADAKREQERLAMRQESEDFEKRNAALHAEALAKEQSKIIGQCKYCGEVFKDRFTLGFYCRRSPIEKHVLK